MDKFRNWIKCLERGSKNKLTANIFPEQVRAIQECFFPADITVHQVSGAHLTIDNQVLVISGETKPYKTCQQF